MAEASGPPSTPPPPAKGGAAERRSGDPAARLLAALKTGRAGEAEALLAGAGFRHPAESRRHLQGLLTPARSRGRAAFLRTLFTELPQCPDPDQALVGLYRFAEARFGPEASHKAAALPSPILMMLFRLCGTSQFLGELLVHHPEHLDWLAADPELGLPRTVKSCLAALTEALRGVAGLEPRRGAAIRAQRRELLRLGVRRIMGLSDEMEMARELSELAQATLQLALDEVTPPLLQRFGAPMEEMAVDSLAPERRASFAVIGMGKLGGRELNFSSDIDLIFVYSDEGLTAGRPDGTGRITNHAFFTHLAEALIGDMMNPSTEGTFYRVDTRLRPDGETGPLVRSLASYEIYYTTQARLWERLALLKARAVAGEASLGHAFESMSRPLVFDPLHNHELILQIADLKQRIDREIRRHAGADREVKRGAGGIREIEFLVQTLQMLHGALNTRFWTAETLEAIRQLSLAGILDRERAGRMAEDYLFLRTIEHRLQMAHLRQTHMMPEGGDALDALALACGLPREGAGAPGLRLMRRWGEVSRRVHLDFTDFFERSARAAEAAQEALAPPSGADAPAQAAARRILSSAPESVALPELAPWGITSGGALKVLRRLGGMGRRMYLTTEGHLAFSQLLPRMLRLLQANPRPEAALGNLESYLNASGAIAGFYTTFLRNPPVFELLLLAFGSGNLLAQTLIAHPEFLDTLADPRAFSSHEDRHETMRRLLAQWLRERADLPRFCRTLAKLKRLEFLLAGLGELAGQLDYPASCGRLSAVAELVIAEALAHAAREMGLAGPLTGFAVLALGKLGAGELNYYSDLDLIFVWDESFAPAAASPGEAATALANKFIERLTYPTPEGAPFNVDARLRPEGQNAPLAPPLARYEEYYASPRAQIWEFQSAMKLRPVAGDLGLGGRLRRRLGEIITRRLRGVALGAEIAAMRRRMEAALKPPRWVAFDIKSGAGGTVDLEFIAQFLQLSHLAEDPELIGLGPLQVFERLAREGRIEPALERALLADYVWLRRLERRSRLLFESEKSLLPAGGDKLEALERACAGLSRERGETTLLEATAKVLRRNRRLFEEIIGE